MENTVKEQLRVWAQQYHKKDFIEGDPVQFPHRYVRKQDIEISGLLTAILSFGSRIQILKKADELDRLMHHSPYAYVCSEEWKIDFPVGCTRSFYRMIPYSAFRLYLEKLHEAYSRYDSLEDALHEYAGTPMERLCTFLGVSTNSPQKKLNMFLRWMIRPEGEVDFGIWTTFNCRDLLIPLDTHVCQMAYELGLIERPSFSLNNARRITAALAEVFPEDPCLGDFALFGYGVNHKKTALKKEV